MSKGSRQRPTDLQAYGSNHETTFGKYVPPYLRNRTEETMQVRVKENTDEIGKCGCGRSPTGKCIGWHGLSEEAFKAKLAEHRAKTVDNPIN
jgi:hypothetical protein